MHPVYMAKLYWRVKRDGKWTWEPVTDYKNALEYLESKIQVEEALYRVHFQVSEEEE